MYMVDRQWRTMASMDSKIANQADDLRALRSSVQDVQGQLNKGIAIASAGPSSGGGKDDSVGDAFYRAEQARQLEDYAEGDWYVNYFTASLKTITPVVSVDADASSVQNYVIETLIQRNPETLGWDSLLAESWKVSEDGMTIDFTLRDNLVFSDGVPITSVDVAFSFDFIMDERIAAPSLRAYYDKIASVEALDEKNVRFVFAEPYFESLGLAGQMSVLAKHFYEPYLEDAEKFNQSKGLLFGSGPYRLEDAVNWTPDAGRVELIRNQRYWGKIQPPYDRLIWNVIDNASARLAAFRNDTIDIYSAKPVEYKSLLEDAQLQQKSQNFEYMSPNAGYSYIGWNQMRDGVPSLFADVKVRLAMTHLTDRERIIEEIQLGYAEIAVSPFNPRSKQHNKDVEAWPADIEKAKALLAEAGFEDRDGDGVIESADGTVFEFELVYYQGSDDSKRIVLFLKDLYARAGVSLIPKPTEWSVMLDFLDSRTFDSIFLGWSSGIETDIDQMFHSDSIEDGDNFVGYKNEELDKLIDQARATVVEEERMPIWQQAEAILHQTQPYTFVMRKESLLFIDDRFKNIEITKLGLNTVQVPVETYVPLDLQKHSK